MWLLLLLLALRVGMRRGMAFGYGSSVFDQSGGRPSLKRYIPYTSSESNTAAHPSR